MSNMTIPDALRVASIFEADDVISVPAMACRILAQYVKELEEQLSFMNMSGEDPRVDTPLQK